MKGEGEEFTSEELARFEQIFKERANFSPYYQLLGMELVELGKGRSLFHLPVEKKLHNVRGIVHGGVLASIADAAIGVSLATLVDHSREAFITVELKVNFMSAVSDGELWAEGKIIKRGKTIAVGEAEVRDGSGNIAAKGIATLLIRQWGKD